MLHQLLGKNNVFLPQSLGASESLANNLNAFFVKKKEAVLVSLPPMNGLELIDSHTTTLNSCLVFTPSNLQVILPEIE